MITPAGVNRSNVGQASDQSFEQLHVDQFAGCDVAGVAGEHDEAIRLRHRRQDAGALVAGVSCGLSPFSIRAAWQRFATPTPNNIPTSFGIE